MRGNSTYLARALVLSCVLILVYGSCKPDSPAASGEPDREIVESLPLLEPQFWPRAPILKMFPGNPPSGWMVGLEGVFATTDGGRSWNRLRTLTEEWYPIAAYFEDSSNAWLTVRLKAPDKLRTRLVRTSDGGQTWLSRTPFLKIRNGVVSPSELVPERLLLFRRGFGVVHSRDWLMLTSDSGQAWHGYEIPDDWFPNSLDGSEFFFTDDKHGWFLNRPANGLWRTSDGGATWDCVDRDFRGEAVSFSDPLRGYAVASCYPPGWDSRPMLLSTLDGGTTWREVGRILTSLSLARPQLTFTDDGALLVKTGVQGPIEVLMGSTDGGKNWSELHRTKWAHFNFSFVSATHGWIVQRNKQFFTVLTSTNGGVDWDVISEIRH